jgi:hypothetical protein
VIREMLAFAAERLMELEVEARTGAPCGVRSPDRQNKCNGYRERPQGDARRPDRSFNPQPLASTPTAGEKYWASLPAARRRSPSGRAFCVGSLIAACAA